MGGLRRTTSEQDAEIVRRYVAGESSLALADEYGFKTHISVLQRVRQAGQSVAARGNRYRDLTPEQVNAVLEMRDRGETQEAIALALGTSQPKISQCLISHGRRTRLAPLGRALTQAGYVLITVDENDHLLMPMVGRRRYLPEHRAVVARALGRPLTPSETVHHINGIKDDNRLENLQLRQGRHGKGVVMRCNVCGSHDITAAPITAS